MGLLDITSNVLTKYKADVSDHVKGLEKLKGAEREAAEAAIKAGKDREKALEGQIEGIGKATNAIEGFKKAVQIGQDGFRAYAEDVKLRAAAGAVNIEKLRSASLGLKSETELLADAAKFQAGAFKLNTEQMAIAEKAMVALTRKGFDSAEANKKVLDAVMALKTDGLADLGIFVDKAGLSMDNAAHRGQIFKNVMAELAKVSGDVKEGQRTATEEIQASGVAFEDAMTKFKTSIGQIVVALGPLIIKVSELVAAAARWAGGGPPGSGDRGAVRGALYWGASTLRNTAAKLLPGSGGEALSEAEYAILREGAASVGIGNAAQAHAAQAALLQNMLRTSQQSPDIYNAWAAGKNVDFGSSQLDLLIENVKGMAGHRYTPGATWEGKPGSGASRPRDMPQIENIWEDGVSKTVGLLIGDAMQWLKQGEGVGPTDNSAFEADRFNAMMENARKSLNATGDTLSADDRYNAFRGKQSKSKLESMFGPLEEFNTYKMAFDGLAGAIGAAMTAWIDGSMSAGKAIKMFIAEALKGLAVQMAVESLKHFAYAAASAIPGPTFNPAGVGGHVKTGLLFAGVAAAAAVGAKALGGGSGGAPSTGAGAAAPVGGAGGGPQYQGRREVIVVGDSWGDNTPRQRALNTRRRVEEAYGAAGVLNE